MKKKRAGPLLAAMLAVGFHWILPVSAFPQTPGAQGTDAAADRGQGVAGTGESAKEEALLHKKAGDEFRLREDTGRAGEEYGKALSLYRGFSKEDRLMMARYLSWSGRNDEAIRELKAILAEDPGNTDARIHLARCLGWKGDLGASLEESSKVLAVAPDNRDALLVRANALKWSGNPNAAISIYKGILGKGEDFDTRVGLSYAFLSTGYIRGAREGESRLTPKFPYQEKERKDLNAEIGKATRSTYGAGYMYYRDSDKNRLDRYSLSGGFWTGNWKWNLGYLHTEADDPSRHARDGELFLSAESKVTEWLGVGGTVGINRTANDNSGNFPVGGVKADARVLDGGIGISFARKVFADTAELIENQVRFSEIASYFEYPLPYRSMFRAGYIGRDYSDDNRSDDWQGIIRHGFGWKNPVVSVGYRIRYLDFRRETESGYFDPDHYVSNRGELNLEGERGKVYVHLSGYFGYQSYLRGGQTVNGTFGGGDMILGVHATSYVALELHGEASDEAGVSASGFSYYQVGCRITGRF